MRAAAGRRLLSERAVQGALDNLEEDLTTGCFERAEPEWGRVLEEAEALSAAFTGRVLCRSLDILHVACARVQGASAFVTGDQRQAALAEAAGLETLRIGG